MAVLTKQDLLTLKEKLPPQALMQLASHVSPELLAAVVDGTADSIDIPDENLAAAEKLYKDLDTKKITPEQANSLAPTSYFNDEGQITLGSPFEKAVYESARNPQSLGIADDVYKGLKIGLHKGENQQYFANQLGADLNSPAVKTGIVASQTGKVVAEMALTGAATAGLIATAGAVIPAELGLGAAALVGSKVPKLANAAFKLARVLPNGGASVLSSAVGGASAGAGANALTNIAGSELANALPGGPGATDESRALEGKSIANEAALTGGINLLANPILEGGVKAAANRLALRQIGDDSAKYATEEGLKLSGKAKNADLNAKEIFNKMAEARHTKYKAAQNAMNIAEHGPGANAKVTLSNLTNSDIDFLKTFDAKDNPLELTPKVIDALKQVRSSLRLDNIKTQKSVNAMTGAVQESVIPPTRTVSDIVSAEKAWDAAFEVAKEAKDSNAKTILSQMSNDGFQGRLAQHYTKDIRDAKEAFMKVKVDYGDPKLDQYANLNKIYNSYDPKTKEVKIDGAELRSILTNSNPNNRATQKIIGARAVDDGLVHPDKVAAVFAGDAAINAEGAKFKAIEGPGNADKTRGIFSKMGLDTGAEVDVQAAGNRFGKPVINKARTKITNKLIPDVTKYSNSLLQGETKDGLLAATGATGQATYDDMVRTATNYSKLKDLNPVVSQNEGFLSKLFNISQNKVNPAFTAGDLITNPKDQVALASTLSQAKLAAGAVPIAARETVQDVGGMLNGGRGAGWISGITQAPNAAMQGVNSLNDPSNPLLQLLRNSFGGR